MLSYIDNLMTTKLGGLSVLPEPPHAFGKWPVFLYFEQKDTISIHYLAKWPENPQARQSLFTLSPLSETISIISTWCISILHCCSSTLVCLIVLSVVFSTIIKFNFNRNFQHKFFFLPIFSLAFPSLAHTIYRFALKSLVSSMPPPHKLSDVFLSSNVRKYLRPGVFYMLK